MGAWAGHVFGTECSHYSFLYPSHGQFSAHTTEAMEVPGLQQLTHLLRLTNYEVSGYE